MRRGPETGSKTGAKTGSKTGAKTGAENFPTDCYGEINKYEWTPSGFMKKMNGDLYRVSRFARDNNCKKPIVENGWAIGRTIMLGNFCQSYLERLYIYFLSATD